MGLLIDKPEARQRGKLTSARYEVLRDPGTMGGCRQANMGGACRYAACATEPLLGTTFDASMLRPGFTDPSLAENVGSHRDGHLFVRPSEVTCATCGGPVGHVSNDRPAGYERCCTNEDSSRERLLRRSPPGVPEGKFYERILG